jgi:glycosyltransferase involved in cell wall biosynthesis
MKVAMYNVTTNVVKGGIETFCIKAAEQLVKRGVDARIVCGTEDGPEEFVRNGVRYHAFPFTNKEEFPDFGTRFRKLCKRLSFAKNCSDFMLKEKFDIVHVHKPFEFPIMHYLRRKGSPAKIVFGGHGTDFFLTDRYYFKRVVDAGVTCSEFNADEIEARYGVRPFVIYNGADTEVFRPMDMQDSRRACGLDPAGKYFGTLGRLIGWKGIQVFIKAMPEILADCPDAKMLIVGGGEYRPELERLAMELGVHEGLIFAGRIEHGRLPLWINSMDMLVQPSIGEEAFGISIIEAMSCGKPVVATASGGIPEIVVDGEVGYIVQRNDETMLADRVITLLNDKELTRKMGTNGRQRVIDEFTWDKVVERLLKIYDKVLDENHLVS